MVRYRPLRHPIRPFRLVGLSGSPSHDPRRRFALTLFLLLLFAALSFPSIAQTDAPTSERDRTFAALMDGAKLVGRFNLSSAQGESEAKIDNYSVSELEKGEDDTWTFHYTMTYGQGPDGPKLTVPIPVKVIWAGDTPVLTMTEQIVEGLGTFSVRIMIYKDRYAGTWDSGTLGGHMWGRIEKATASE